MPAVRAGGRGRMRGQTRAARTRQGAVSYLNYRDARKKRLTRSPGEPATLVAGGRRRRGLICHAQAKHAGHVRVAGRDRGDQETGCERSSWGPRTARESPSQAAAGPRSAAKCCELTCCRGCRA
jgi:hypothetical protein